METRRFKRTLTYLMHGTGVMRFPPGPTILLTKVLLVFLCRSPIHFISPVPAPVECQSGPTLITLTDGDRP